MGLLHELTEAIDDSRPPNLLRHMSPQKLLITNHPGNLRSSRTGVITLYATQGSVVSSVDCACLPGRARPWLFPTISARWGDRPACPFGQNGLVPASQVRQDLPCEPVQSAYVFAALQPTLATCLLYADDMEGHVRVGRLLWLRGTPVRL